MTVYIGWESLLEKTDTPNQSFKDHMLRKYIKTLNETLTKFIGEENVKYESMKTSWPEMSQFYKGKADAYALCKERLEHYLKETE